MNSEIESAADTGIESGLNRIRVIVVAVAQRPEVPRIAHVSLGNGKMCDEDRQEERGSGG